MIFLYMIEFSPLEEKNSHVFLLVSLKTYLPCMLASKCVVLCYISYLKLLLFAKPCHEAALVNGPTEMCFRVKLTENSCMHLREKGAKSL
jgi:hypothetical protein